MKKHVLAAVAAVIALAACGSSTAPESAAPGSAMMDEAAAGNGSGSGHGAMPADDGTLTTATTDSTTSRIGNGFGSGY